MRFFFFSGTSPLSPRVGENDPPPPPGPFGGRFCSVVGRVVSFSFFRRSRFTLFDSLSFSLLFLAGPFDLIGTHNPALFTGT